MAFLRSDIINKELVDAVLSKIEGTKKVALETLTVGPSPYGRATLLEERYGVQATAKIRGHAKDYHWIAKILRSDVEKSNHARFLGILETESNFYQLLVPELTALGAPLPQFYPLLHSEYKKLGREILLLSDIRQLGFEAIKIDGKDLDLGHTIKAIEWMARLHGLGYVLLAQHPRGPTGWIEDNPWIRKEDQERKEKPQTVHIDETDADGFRSRLMAMAARAIKSQTENNKRVDQYLERQNWLDDLRQEMWSNESASSNQIPFRTILHGEPWHGNVLYQYKKDPDQLDYPFTAALGDLQSCTYGRPGSDIAHFLLTSTTREFRKKYLDIVLKAYLLELEDVIQSQGMDHVPYSMQDLSADYKQGLVLGITFCLFAMPMLSDEQVDGPVQIGDYGDEVDSADALITPTIANKILEGIQEVLE
ncbi:uncharacterized protein LOC131877903 [Tigriopus californicus]|uniref:uncharacterized protein LOC131877903 n=1 Tax=Tigriopus californicus TaxID=6832 RepID=UPI0027DA486B|nr:uncharacterized protein LOC131877903 [Tigriopus californicus]